MTNSSLFLLADLGLDLVESLRRTIDMLIPAGNGSLIFLPGLLELIAGSLVLGFGLGVMTSGSDERMCWRNLIDLCALSVVRLLLALNFVVIGGVL